MVVRKMQNGERSMYFEYGETEIEYLKKKDKTRRYPYGCMANTQLPHHDFYSHHPGSLL